MPTGQLNIDDISLRFSSQMILNNPERTSRASQPFKLCKVIVIASEEFPVPQGWSPYEKKREADTNRENVMQQQRQKLLGANNTKNDWQ